jgi:NIMA (never in mitosis gene a)-related kinase
LDSLKHRNIVQLIQKIKDVKNERIYIVMEVGERESYLRYHLTPGLGSSRLELIRRLTHSQYCTSGDLGSLIRKAQRTGQPIHEDKIWNIFLQITLALHHCHWPESRSSKNGRNSGGNGNGPNGANGSGSSGEGSAVGRYQVLHRDLKPENGEIWLDPSSYRLVSRHPSSLHEHFGSGLSSSVLVG